MAGRKTGRSVGRPKKMLAETNSGRLIEQHPLFDEVRDMLAHHFNTETIVRMLETRFQVGFQNGSLPPLPSARTIRRWREEHMPGTAFLPESVIQTKLKNVDIQIDYYQSLQRVYSLAEDRVARFATVEDDFPMPLPGLKDAFETLLKVGEQMWKIGQDMGLYPRPMPFEFMAEAQAASSSRASAQVAVFNINGEIKSAEQMSDAELDAAERQISAGTTEPAS